MNDTDTKKHSQIKFMNLILGVIIVIFIVGIGITLYNSTRESGANVTENSNNIGNIQNEEKTLDIIDKELGEFKINGMDLINAIVAVDESDGVKIGTGYNYMSTSNGIKQYGVSENVISTRAGAVYPSILIGISEETDNVVAIGVGDPYDYNGYIDSMYKGNYRRLQRALENLGYSNLWNTIDKMKTSFEQNESEKYLDSGLNGVYYTYTNGYSTSSGTNGINYILFKATGNTNN